MPGPPSTGFPSAEAGPVRIREVHDARPPSGAVRVHRELHAARREPLVGFLRVADEEVDARLAGSRRLLLPEIRTPISAPPRSNPAESLNPYSFVIPSTRSQKSTALFGSEIMTVTDQILPIRRPRLRRRVTWACLAASVVLEAAALLSSGSTRTADRL